MKQHLQPIHSAASDYAKKTFQRASLFFPFASLFPDALTETHPAESHSESLSTALSRSILPFLCSSLGFLLAFLPPMGFPRRRKKKALCHGPVERKWWNSSHAASVIKLLSVTHPASDYKQRIHSWHSPRLFGSGLALGRFP